MLKSDISKGGVLANFPLETWPSADSSKRTVFRVEENSWHSSMVGASDPEDQQLLVEAGDTLSLFSVHVAKVFDPHLDGEPGSAITCDVVRTIASISSTGFVCFHFGRVFPSIVEHVRHASAEGGAIMGLQGLWN